MNIERNAKGEIKVNGKLVKGIKMRPEDGIGLIVGFLSQLQEKKEDKKKKKKGKDN